MGVLSSVWKDVKRNKGKLVGGLLGGPAGSIVGAASDSGVLSDIGGSITGSTAQHAAERAADAGLQTAREAEALNRERYLDAQEGLSPYTQGAERAYGRLSDIMGVGRPRPQSIGTQGIRGGLLHAGSRGGYGTDVPLSEGFGPEPGQGQGFDYGGIPGAETGDPYAGLMENEFMGGGYGDYMGEFLPELPEMDYQDTAAYQQSQDAIRNVGEERQMAAAEAMGATGGFYGGRRAEAAAEIGGDQAIDLANLEQGSMQNYYDRLARSQQMRQSGAGALSGLEQQDLARQAAQGETNIGRRESRYFDQQGQNRQAFTNYMNTLQNLASPQVAQNLASLGVGQGATIGAQNIGAQQAAGAQRVAGQTARDQATGNLIGTALQVGGFFI